MEEPKIKIRILKKRGIYEAGEEIETSVPHGQQWINSGFAELASENPVKKLVEVPEPEVVAEEVQEIIEEVAEESELDYSEMTNASLKSLLEARELPTTGNKQILIDRLLDDDYTKSFVGPEVEQ
jgi:hypothetical protein